MNIFKKIWAFLTGIVAAIPQPLIDKGNMALFLTTNISALLNNNVAATLNSLLPSTIPFDQRQKITEAFSIVFKDLKVIDLPMFLEQWRAKNKIEKEAILIKIAAAIIKSLDNNRFRDNVYDTVAQVVYSRLAAKKKSN